MDMDVIWSAILTAMVGFIVWWIKSHAEETKRIQILLNQTREHLARDYVTKADQQATMDRVMDRFDALDAKLDRLMERRS